MKNKASLSLMEQMIMLLVFALAAAICLKAFVGAEHISAASRARDRAAVEAQSAAEVIKYCRGDMQAAAEKLGGQWDGQRLQYGYRGVWNEEGEEYTLCAQAEETGLALLGGAAVAVTDEEGETLFELSVRWQKEGADG